MKKLIYFATRLTFTAAAAGQCWALEFGELAIHSFLNEPLSAEIAVLEADGLRDGDMQVGIAPMAEFVRFEMNRDVFLSEINFVVKWDDAGKRIVLSTETPLRKPYLDFVMEALWPDGRLLREYTLSVGLRSRAAKDLPLRSESEITKPEVLADAESVYREVDRDYDPSPLDRPVAGANYVTTSSDTLWRIASTLVQQGVSVQQIMLAIVAANPSAFMNGNVNGLKSGCNLQLPAGEERDVDAVSARAEIKLQNEAWAKVGTWAGSCSRSVADLDLDVRIVPSDVELKREPASEKSFTDLTLQNVGDDQILDIRSESLAVVEPLQINELGGPVDHLNAIVDELQFQLAKRDTEIAELRAELASRPVSRALPAPPGIVESTAQRSQSLPVSQVPDWAVMAGIGTLLTGLFALTRVKRRQRRQLLSLDENVGVLQGTETSSVSITGLTPAPLEDISREGIGETDVADASIYGAETDPIDSKLDLARAYIDMGDEDGARPVLLEAINHGDPGQQAEARELLLRIKGS